MIWTLQLTDIHTMLGVCYEYILYDYSFSWMQAEACLQQSQSNMAVVIKNEEEVPSDQEGIGSSDTFASAAASSASAEGTAMMKLNRKLMKLTPLHQWDVQWG